MARENEVKLIQVESPNFIPEKDTIHPLCLEVSHLGIDFGGLTAVDDFNMALGKTEICGLIGPNGAGKTTVFNLLTKVYQPTRGTIQLEGRDTHGMNTTQVNQAGIARTFQNIRLFDKMSVEDNVKIGSNTVLVSPVTVEEGANVGAGSVVCGEFPQNVVIAGNPARIIKSL